MDPILLGQAWVFVLSDLFYVSFSVLNQVVIDSGGFCLKHVIQPNYKNNALLRSNSTSKVKMSK